MAVATVAALDLNDRVKLDEDTVLQAAQDDPTYQLLLAKVTGDAWLDRRSQEMPCLRAFYTSEIG